MDSRTLSMLPSIGLRIPLLSTTNFTAFETTMKIAFGKVVGPGQVKRVVEWLR